MGGKDAGLVTVTPANLKLESKERGCAIVKLAMPKERPQRDDCCCCEDIEVVIWVRGCRNHYLRWIVALGRLRGTVLRDDLCRRHARLRAALVRPLLHSAAVLRLAYPKEGISRWRPSTRSSISSSVTELNLRYTSTLLYLGKDYVKDINTVVTTSNRPSRPGGETHADPGAAAADRGHARREPSAPRFR